MKIFARFPENLITFVHVLLQIQVEAWDFLSDLKYYEVIEPIHVNHGHDKRDLSTNVHKHFHFDETTFVVTGFNRTFVMKLKKNRLLLPKKIKFFSQNEDGSMKMEESTENCFYHGEIENRKKSKVTLSTCFGLSGLVQDEDGEEFFIEPHLDMKRSHILYKMKDLKVKTSSSCGHDNTINHLQYSPNEIKQQLANGFNQRSRHRRDVAVWKYIEIAVVVDNALHNKWGNSTEVSKARALDVLNYVDVVYKTIKTRVAVVAVIIWDVEDKIEISKSSSNTLGRFTNYIQKVIYNEMKIYYDNAQLMSGIDFGGAVVGLSGIGNICTLASCGINQYRRNPAVAANTVAHELGHNLGFFHNGCNCKNKPCVMSAYVVNSQVKGFSSCTIKTFEKQNAKGRYPCLYDYPDKRVGNIVCGNGYKEGEEKCDCGTAEECKKSGADQCCNPATCELQKNAQCADGACCSNCMFKSLGTLCRRRMQSECDLEEYCTGSSGRCPRNYYIKDGKPCGNKESYCYQGVCRTHTQQCETLWGPNGFKAEQICFSTNSIGNAYGNCGMENKKYIRCNKSDVLCGKIQCQSKPNTKIPTWPRLGSHRAINMANFYVGSKTYHCKRVRMSFPKELEDPTITFDGTKCADNSICINHKCTNISTLQNIKNCDKECQNGGVCNNNGHCHCPVGFACPYCEKPGKGGSIDSGQGCEVIEPTTTMTTTSNTTHATEATSTKQIEKPILGKQSFMRSLSSLGIVPFVVVVLVIVAAIVVRRKKKPAIRVAYLAYRNYGFDEMDSTYDHHSSPISTPTIPPDQKIK